MGSQILNLAGRDSAFKIVGAIEAENHPAVGKTILDGKIRITADLASLKNSAEALIDFTSPQATLTHLKIIQNWKKISAVIGTTGFSNIQIAELKKIARKIPVLLSPNMSVGVNLLFNLVRDVAKKLLDYDIEIIEAHHNQKKDAPSGTALAIAKEIAEELKLSSQSFVYGRKGEVGARKKREIGIHAVRAGDIVGEHRVLFASHGERIELTHQASSRDAFASGALRATKWIVNKKAGFYSMQDVLS